MTTTSRDRRPAGTKSRGRGAAAAFGFILLFTGLIGGGVLLVLSLNRHDKAIENFARAGVGCTTSLEFSKSGTFYVYAETEGTFDPEEIGCEPQATPGQAFAIEFDGPAPVSPRPDSSISYDTDDFTGTSKASFEITEPGTYELVVRGDSLETWAAVGRDPSDKVDEMRRGAILVAAIGVVLGGLLLALAGRRSKRAATPSIPEGPGWGPRPGDGAVRAWPPEPPRIPQVPINPHQPDTPAAVAPPPPPLPARAPRSAAPARSPWAPPPPGAGPVHTAPPEPVERARPPELPPTLPD
jgi:hypothetical protein